MIKYMRNPTDISYAYHNKKESPYSMTGEKCHLHFEL